MRLLESKTHLNARKKNEVNLGAFSFLFAEIINYHLSRSDGVEELEGKLQALGAEVGSRLHQLCVHQQGVKRSVKILDALYYLQHVFYKWLFNKPADSLEVSDDHRQCNN
jgi:hypothetical protein